MAIGINDPTKGNASSSSTADAPPEPWVRQEEIKAAEFIAPKTVPVVVAARPTGTKYDWMREAGIPERDWTYVDFIITRESGWCPTKWNGQRECLGYYVPNRFGSGAYGLGQALPPSKMAPFGSDYLTDPVTQLRWAHRYALSRYGSWYQAQQFWISHRWW